MAPLRGGEERTHAICGGMRCRTKGRSHRMARRGRLRPPLVEVWEMKRNVNSRWQLFFFFFFESGFLFQSQWSRNSLTHWLKARPPTQ